MKSVTASEHVNFVSEGQFSFLFLVFAAQGRL